MIRKENNMYSFNDRKKEIKFDKSNPPTPWMNYLTNGVFTTMISQAGGRSRILQVTPDMENQPLPLLSSAHRPQWLLHLYKGRKRLLVSDGRAGKNSSAVVEGNSRYGVYCLRCQKAWSCGESHIFCWRVRKLPDLESQNQKQY